jgi:hypothetical protein
MKSNYPCLPLAIVWQTCVSNNEKSTGSPKRRNYCRRLAAAPGCRWRPAIAAHSDCIASREIGAYFGRELGKTAVTNLWIPDGYKDTPVDRAAPRQRLLASLDQIFAQELDPAHNLDAVECKLFGIGSESYVVGSHEFYLAYAASRQKLLCLDAGHFHPTETIADKISSTLLYVPELLLHVSRGVRLDSDHVVTLTDELQAIMQEIVRGRYLERVHIGLDFFDASVNRIAAWSIGARNALRALLLALLEPIDEMRALELAGDYTGRLALLEELKGMPFGAAWDYYCLEQDVPVGITFLDDIRSYVNGTRISRMNTDKKKSVKICVHPCPIFIYSWSAAGACCLLCKSNLQFDTRFGKSRYKFSFIGGAPQARVVSYEKEVLAHR